MGLPYVGTTPANAGDLAPKSYVDAGDSDIKTTTLGGLTFVKLTQAAYNALGAGRPSTTIYFIVG